MEANQIYEKIGKLTGMLEEMHITHNLNRDNISKTLEQALKTNGRVTNIEQYIEEQHKINSKLNGMLTAQHERLEGHEKNYSYSMGVLKVLGIVGTLVLVVGGYIFTLIVKDITRDNVQNVLTDYQALMSK